jgi:hypothetical protein
MHPGLPEGRHRSRGAANWVRAGVETLVVKELAGHKSVVTTQRYVGELTGEDLARIQASYSHLRTGRQLKPPNANSRAETTTPVFAFVGNAKMRGKRRRPSSTVEQWFCNFLHSIEPVAELIKRNGAVMGGRH